MSRMSWIGVVTLSAAWLAACASGAPAPADETALRAALARRADAWDKAIVAKNTQAVAANMADDFRQIRSSGDVVDKQTFLRDITSPELTSDPYTVEDFDVRILGDTALLSGTTRMTGRYRSEAFATHYRYIDIYVRRGGTWRVVSVQITPIRD
jgi:ketosteroid isomerase-like protein